MARLVYRGFPPPSNVLCIIAATRTPSTLPCSFTSVSSALRDPWMIFVTALLSLAAA
jgi:hypothetical protein